MKKALLCLAIASLGACKKDSDPVASPSRTDLLTTPKWKITGGTIGSGATAFPISVILPTCYNDDTFKFNADKLQLVYNDPICELIRNIGCHYLYDVFVFKVSQTPHGLD